MAVLERHPVRPRPGKLILFVLGCLLFVGLGLWMAIMGGLIAKIAGLVAIAFFGGGLLLVMLVAIRRGGLTQLTLTESGIEVADGGTIPWSDVESVGVTTGSGNMVWLRLHSYDRYLASMTEQGRRQAGWRIRFLKPFAHLLRLVPLLRRYADQVRGPEDELRWNREHFGYDLAYSTVWLDRSPEKFAELLERYHRASGAG
jgi:hypothetical protein